MISRVIDVLLAFPGLLLAIALVAVLGPSLGNVLFALTIIGWVGYARLVRGQVLRAREFEYVQAARALGARTPRILWRHVIPTAMPAVVVQATLGMAGAIIGEAALSFLGLGVQPPTPSWGTMLNGGRAHLLDAPHLTIFPGLAIALLVLGFNFLGDGLRDLTDPKRRSDAGRRPMSVRRCATSAGHSRVRGRSQPAPTALIAVRPTGLCALPREIARARCGRQARRRVAVRTADASSQPIAVAGSSSRSDSAPIGRPRREVGSSARARRNRSAPSRGLEMVLPFGDVA